MNNMSNGKNNGIVLMYCKEGVIYPVALTQEQLDILDMGIGMFLQGKLNVISDKPVGEIMNYCKNK
jgi:hypothetical protein